MKESEKKNKYLDFAREMKKLWNMKVTIIPVVIGTHRNINKGTGGLGNNRTSGDHYWDRAEYWDESWRLEETFCHSNSSEGPSANADVKNSQGVKNNDDNDNNPRQKNLLKVIAGNIPVRRSLFIYLFH